MDKISTKYSHYKIIFIQERVALWWPNGYGQQKLYPIAFSIKCYAGNSSHLSSRMKSQKVLKIGFRTIELVEDKDGEFVLKLNVAKSNFSLR